MDQSEFWNLIATIDGCALNKYDEEAAVQPLVKSLAELYADESGPSGLSGDGFLYARCFVVAMGKTHYETTKANPVLMPKSPNEWCESLLYVVPKAWSVVTGNDIAKWEHSSKVSYESFSNKVGWEGQ